ncbi:MAG: DUF3392 family protein [Planctomycetota bacterium]
MITNFFATATKWMDPYNDEICVAIVATLLVLYGSAVNKFVQGHVKQLHMVLRFVIFVLLCGFGYGLATVLLADLLEEILWGLPRTYISPTVVGIFAALALLAERRNQL